MDDAANHAAIIHPRLAAHVFRQMRLDLTPLFVAQPKQVAPHPLLCSESSAEANQQPIQLATTLLGFDPSLHFDIFDRRVRPS